MGDIKRKRKQYSRPKKLFDSERIKRENAIVEKYGLKNKKEVWKAQSKVSRLRNMAKQLISGSVEEQQKFFDRLNKVGLNVKELSDVLALTPENWLDRRLQTIVFKKGLANTPRHARQRIVHKHILVDGSIVNSPSFVVSVDLEGKIEVLKKEKTKKKEAPAEEENKEEVVEEGRQEVGEEKENVEENKEDKE